MSTTPGSERSLQVASIFDAVAQTYDAVGVDWFGPIGERLVRELAPQPGEDALDLGCGRGAALFPLAEAVGEEGRVVGIDLAAAMVERTRADVEERGLGTVELHVMDAAAPDLPERSFDVAAARVSGRQSRRSPDDSNNSVVPAESRPYGERMIMVMVVRRVRARALLTRSALPTWFRAAAVGLAQAV